MTDPVDLIEPTQTAVFNALNGFAGLTALSGVFQHVPQDTEPPMTIVGDIEATPIGGKGEQVEQISVEVVTIYRGAGRARLLAIMHQQRLALEGQEVAHVGIAFDTPEWTGAGINGPAADGVTYAGIQTFTIIAEPA